MVLTIDHSPHDCALFERLVLELRRIDCNSGSGSDETYVITLSQTTSSIELINSDLAASEMLEHALNAFAYLRHLYPRPLNKDNKAKVYVDGACQRYI